MRNAENLIDIVSELNCDTKFNTVEEEKLREYIDSNKSFLLGQGTVNEETFRLLEFVFASKRISEEDKNYLINALKNEDSFSNLSSELSNIKTKIINREIIGNDLICLLDNEEYVQEVHNKAQTQLKMALNSYTKSNIRDKEIIVISLSLIALNSYDGGFYEGVRKEYQELYNEYSDQKIEGLIREILNLYRLPEEKCSRDRIINVVLKNAIVPKHFLASFFDFIFDIYKINFSYDLPSYLYEEFKFVYEGMMNYMISDDDEFKASVTQKTYKLIKTTKELVRSGNLNELIDLSISVVNIIDKITWQKNFTMPNKYFEFGYNNWMQGPKKQENELERCNQRYSLNSRWEPRYILKDNCIYLVPPMHRVKDIYKSWEIYIVIKNKDKVIKRIDNPEIKEIFGGYQISADMVKIDNPLSEIRYMIFAGDKKIYDSDKKLFKEYVIFDEIGNELKNDHDYCGDVAVCYDKQIENRKPYFECSYYVLTKKTVKIGDSILFDENVFSFSSATKAGVYGEKRIDHLIIDNRGKEYPVYKTIRYLVFEDDSKNSVIELVINGKQHKINDYYVVVAELSKNNRFSIDMSLLKTDIYDISVNKLYKGSKKELLNVSFVLDKELETNLIEINGKYDVAIKSNLFNAPIYTEFDLEKFNVNGISFIKDNKEYLYMIPFGMEIYRLTDGPWKMLKEDFIVDEIQRESVMEIYGLNADSAMLMGSNGSFIDTDVQIYDKGPYKKCYIGKLTEYKNLYDFINIIFLLEKKAIGMVRCYFKCILDRNGIYFDYNTITSKLTINTRYLGSGPIYYKIQDKNEKNVFISSKKRSEEPISISGLKSFEKYNIQVCWDDVDGITHNLYESKRIFYSRKDLIGNSFKLKEGYINEKKGKKIVDVKVPLKECYLSITDKIDDGTFVGKVYSKTYNGKYYLNNINPVDIEICTDEINGTIEVYLTNSGDGLLFDKKYSNIMNSLDNKNASDIFIYNMDFIPISE